MADFILCEKIDSSAVSKNLRRLLSPAELLKIKKIKNNKKKLKKSFQCLLCWDVSSPLLSSTPLLPAPSLAAQVIPVL